MVLVVRTTFLLFVLSFLTIPNLFSKEMKGRVYDVKTNQPMSNVNVVNTFTERGMTTDSNGLFTLQVEKGHLIECRKIGFKIVRVRISSDELPYYNLGMREGAFDLDEVEIRGNNHKADSIEKRETYKWAIDHYELTGLDAIQHPFDALSKRNKQIWAFQKRYQYFEREKFIDYVFNERLIKKLTAMDSTDINIYQRNFRPSYEQVKQWTEYEFMEYIKRSAAVYIKRKRP